MSKSTRSIGDGEFDSDRYNMLSDLNLQEKDLAPVAAAILAQDHIGLELAAVLMARPMPSLAHGLWNEFRESEKRRDFAKEIYSLACLQQIGEDIAPHLTGISASLSPTNDQHKFIESLQQILKRRGLEFADVEVLGYPDRSIP